MLTGLFTFSKLLKWGLVIGFFAVLGFLGWQWQQSMNGRITALIKQNQELVVNNATLAGNNNTLKDAVSDANASVDQLQQAFADVKKNYDELSGRFLVIRSQRDELRDRLARHDLGALAVAKPALVEKTINSATASALRCLEVETGAARLPDEKNTECPWLFGE